MSATGKHPTASLFIKFAISSKHAARTICTEESQLESIYESRGQLYRPLRLQWQELNQVVQMGVAGFYKVYPLILNKRRPALRFAGYRGPD